MNFIILFINTIKYLLNLKKTLHITGIKQNLTIIQREENLPKPISNVSS